MHCSGLHQTPSWARFVASVHNACSFYPRNERLASIFYRKRHTFWTKSRSVPLLDAPYWPNYTLPKFSIPYRLAATARLYFALTDMLAS